VPEHERHERHEEDKEEDEDHGQLHADSLEDRLARHGPNAAPVPEHERGQRGPDEKHQAERPRHRRRLCRDGAG